jgi:hypothetical protein
VNISPSPDWAISLTAPPHRWRSPGASGWSSPKDGTHLGCEHGVCGACTVLIDGRTARGCLTLAAQVCEHAVDTIEGLTESGGSEPDRIDINMEPARSKKMP